MKNGSIRMTLFPSSFQKRKGRGGIYTVIDIFSNGIIPPENHHFTILRNILKSILSRQDTHFSVKAIHKSGARQPALPALRAAFSPRVAYNIAKPFKIAEMIMQ